MLLYKERRSSNQRREGELPERNLYIVAESYRRKFKKVSTLLLSANVRTNSGKTAIYYLGYAINCLTKVRGRNRSLILQQRLSLLFAIRKELVNPTIIFFLVFFLNIL